MNMTTLEIAFSAVDSLYFRGSRPHAAAGASALASAFPPPASTFSGALRTRLGDALGLDWDALRQGKYRQRGPELPGVDLGQLMGTADDTGLLQFSAPVIRKDGEPLYPVPAALLKSDAGLVRMSLGSAVQTDLGYVHLPSLPDGVQGAKPLGESWLTAKGMQQFLNGDLPGKEQILGIDNLAQYESRVGIGRNAPAGTVVPGLLFQTEHLRLEPDVDFSIEVTLPEVAADCLLDSIKRNPLQRFGGEGRMSELMASKSGQTEVGLSPASAPGLLVLATDMLPDQVAMPAPFPGFRATVVDGIDCWVGEIGGTELYLLSVVSDKPRRLGGWDIQNNRPRAVQSYIPAGSCFYVRPVNASDNLQHLHGKQFGRRTDFGFGTLLCGA